MILYPKLYVNYINDITYDILKENNIKALILDVDNTIIDYNKNMPITVEPWCQDLKNKGIKFCIVSNSNNKEKVENVSKILEIPYIFFAKKPLKSGFKRAREILKLEYSEIAAVGDQIFTDILGANRCKIFSILVEPIEEKDIFITLLKRPIEKQIKSLYLKKQNKEKIRGEK